MPRYSGVSKKRNKRANIMKMYHARRRVLNLIQKSNTFVAEDAPHLDYFCNLPEDNLPELNIESETNRTQYFSEEELRLVSPQYFIRQIKSMYDHEKTCTMEKLNFFKEKREGFKSILHFKCVSCEMNFIVRCLPPDTEKKQNVNNDCVWGLMSTGSGYNQGHELFSIMNIPFMERKTYMKYKQKVATTWQNNIVSQMKHNADVEKAMAIEVGDVEDGISFITVIVDGGWAKRSYDHGYSSLSGVACIIGSKTKKLLYLEVRNKFCYVCVTSRKNHICYKNFSGSSNSMEQEVIVEGFNLSIVSYGIKYKYMIGDGDSSVYARVLQNISYGRHVIKLECGNHVTRACTSNLYKLVKNSTFDSSVRQIIRSKLVNYSRHLRFVISQPNNLRKNLENVLLHVFGDHTNCEKTICKHSKDSNSVELLKSGTIWNEIVKINNRVVAKSGLLSSNVTTNFTERFMATVAKLTGGKRTNLVLRGYQNRCMGAGLMYNLGYEYHKLSKNNGYSKKYLDAFCDKRRKVKEMRKNFNKRKEKPITCDEDADYGPMAAEPDKYVDELNKLKNKIMSKLEDSNVAKIEQKTVGQAKNIYWIVERRCRITASKFGKICKLRLGTDRTNTIKSLFYANEQLKTAAIAHGLDHKPHAIEKYETLFCKTVAPCGLYVFEKLRYLGASPDGVLDDKTIIEVKCLYSIRNSKIKDAASDKKDKLCVALVNNKLILKDNHDYMYQIQDQLLITDRQKCDLILYTDIDLEVVTVTINSEFCDKMLTKLQKFLFDYALPELADPRIPRSMKVPQPL